MASQELPPELAERVLLSTGEEDLPSLCSASRLYYVICTSGHFWRQRFREEGIPYLPGELGNLEGLNLGQLIALYQKAKKATNRAEEQMMSIQDSGQFSVILTGGHGQVKAFDVPWIDHRMLEGYMVQGEKDEEEMGKVARMRSAYLRGGGSGPREMAYVDLLRAIDRSRPRFEITSLHGGFFYRVYPEEELHPLSPGNTFRLLFRLNFYST